MPGFINLSAHLSAPQGLTRLTNVRFFDSWAFLGLTSLKCTLILAGRPGGESEEGVHPLAGQGGVWAPMFMYRAKVTWVWCIAHVSTQDLGGSIYIDFCLPCQPKQSKTLRIWNFEVNFFRRRLAHNERGRVSSQGQCFSSEFGWFNLPRFLFTLSAKTIKTPRVWNCQLFPTAPCSQWAWSCIEPRSPGSDVSLMFPLRCRICQTAWALCLDHAQSWYFVNLNIEVETWCSH